MWHRAAPAADPLGGQGAIILLYALGGMFAVISGYFQPEPAADRLQHDLDSPSKLGIFLAMDWVVWGLFIGAWVAWLLAYPDFTFGAGWSSFDRLGRSTPPASSSASAAMR